MERHGREEGREGGRRHRGDRSGDRHGTSGAQTFRRGRILVFLEQLKVKRATLVRQLKEPEFQPIEQMLRGELKALDQIIEEYIHLFELQEDGVESANRGSASADGRGERE